MLLVSTRTLPDACDSLGLHTLAVTHYEKVLKLVEARKDNVSPTVLLL